MEEPITVTISPFWALMMTPALTPFEQAVERCPRYDLRAFQFVFQSLGAVAEKLPEQRHITGKELAEALLELARNAFGVSAPLILNLWGIHRSEDIGEIVFAMVEVGLLGRHEEDRREDFDGLFTVEGVFAGEYAWPGVKRLVEARSAA